MPNAVDDVMGQIDSSREGALKALLPARLTAVDDDQKHGTAQALDRGWTRRVRLWQPRILEEPDHIHPVPESRTTGDGGHTHGAVISGGDHDHDIPGNETDPAGKHTHTFEYRNGDTGVLIQLRGNVPVFLGGL